MKESMLGLLQITHLALLEVIHCIQLGLLNLVVLLLRYGLFVFVSLSAIQFLKFCQNQVILYFRIIIQANLKLVWAAIP